MEEPASARIPQHLAAGGRHSRHRGRRHQRRAQGVPAQLRALPRVLADDAAAAAEIGATLFNFMMRADEELRLDVPLAAIGVDSLVSIELRNRFRQKAGVPSAASIADFGKMTTAKLGEKYNQV